MVFDKRIIDEEVSAVIKYLDTDGNGSISFQEFENAFLKTSSTPKNPLQK